jgi:FecR protein
VFGRDRSQRDHAATVAFGGCTYLDRAATVFSTTELLTMSNLIAYIMLSASIFAMVLLVLIPHAWAQTSVGSISAVSGTVSLERAGGSIPAAGGAAVQVGDKFTTGPNSRVTIKLSDGSQLELNDSSTLVLTEDALNPDGSRASTKVTLLGGVVRSMVHFNPAGAPNFEVHTPTGVVSAPRSTMFEVSYHEVQPLPSVARANHTPVVIVTPLKGSPASMNRSATAVSAAPVVNPSPAPRERTRAHLVRDSQAAAGASRTAAREPVLSVGNNSSKRQGRFVSPWSATRRRRLARRARQLVSPF